MGIPERFKNVQILDAFFKKNGITPSIFIDVYHQGIWWNAKRCWQSVSGDYHLVIQDDAHICNEDSFFKNLYSVIDYVVDHNDKYLINLYAPYSHNKYILLLKNGLIEYKKSGTGVALIMSKINILRMLNWVTKYIPDEEAPHLDDERIGAWQHFSKIQTLLPVPLLVYHDMAFESTTKFGKKRKRINTIYSKGEAINLSNKLHAPSYPVYKGFMELLRKHG